MVGLVKKKPWAPTPTYDVLKSGFAEILVILGFFFQMARVRKPPAISLADRLVSLGFSKMHMLGPLESPMFCSIQQLSDKPLANPTISWKPGFAEILVFPGFFLDAHVGGFGKSYVL